MKNRETVTISKISKVQYEVRKDERTCDDTVVAILWKMDGGNDRKALITCTSVYMCWVL